MMISFYLIFLYANSQVWSSFFSLFAANIYLEQRFTAFFRQVYKAIKVTNLKALYIPFSKKAFYLFKRLFGGKISPDLNR